MGEMEAEISIIGQKKEALAVKIEATHGVEVGPFGREEIVDGGPLKLIIVRADEPPGLVQGYVNLASGFGWLAIQGHLVVDGINLGPKLAHYMAVDRHTAFDNQLLPGPARNQTRIRQKFLKPYHRDDPPKGKVRTWHPLWAGRIRIITFGMDLIKIRRPPWSCVGR